MKKIVFYSFYDNYRRCQYVDIWRKAFPEEAKNCVFIEARPGIHHPRARRLGYLFLHSGDQRSVRIYEQMYERIGIPAVNVRTIKSGEAKDDPKPKGIEILEISPIVRKPRAARKAK